MQLTVQVAVALVAAVMVVCPVSAQLVDCPAVEGKDDNATLFYNPYNCSTYYVCDHGTPVLMPCPLGTKFNDESKICDHPDDANCFELQPPTEAPTTEAAPEDQPLTEKIIITKTTKEIIRPVEPAPEADPVA
ncbi:hypothetical protein HPB47_015502 [Ixodes persulcatus]|uniref:Uncharacterized protein n=1 Tax=Ixodes persulcatus TaxID=34615 RepID=A0AC60QVY6_IXOPE|nr:hypothetical protein HPB47_015502 [Ixodes persulcatus]